eukprot:TRINITY_DN9410_c0_g1_i1.p1 TRINITY_DN9410_c0_g1~~TRINITY_DN9410_c0_g1_i1.p1  ORF type:complete len:306 (+),score=76.20 TRINITY_DN9410_c0_g1_i1:29-919(+)
MCIRDRGTGALEAKFKPTDAELWQQVVAELTEEDKGTGLISSMQRTKFYKIQLQRLAQGKNKQISLYSPIDFFEGGAEKRAESVRRLFETPQNNLTVHKNGSRVDFDGLMSHPEGQTLLATVCEIFNVEELLVQSIVKVQKLFSQETTLDANRAYKQLLERFVGRSKEEVGDAMLEACKIILQELGQESTSKSTDQKKDGEGTQTLTGLLVTLMKFVLSITFRDLSIMINVHLPSNEALGETDAFERFGFRKLRAGVFYKVQLIDISPKSVAKAESFLVQENELLAELLSVLFKRD